MLTFILSLLFGAVVGLSLGLTGGGGAIFAVPLLVYGLAIPAQDAVGVSLAAVGATALVGFIFRWSEGQVEISTGLLFALAGMIGAPLGAWIGGLLSEPLLLTLFAGLMVTVAVRLWRKAELSGKNPAESPEQQGTCERDPTGSLLLTSNCAILLLSLGAATGVLAGLFGVGGGFVIVPALVLYSGMTIHRAVGSSLLFIALSILSGVVSHEWVGRDVDPTITGLFVLGGIGGLFVGQSIGRRLSGARLQKVFAVAILAVAGFVLFRNLLT